MSRRWVRVVVASASFVAWTGTATAWAQDETPPANFGPPPPGHEPPPPWSPGDSTAAPAPVTSDILPTFLTLDRVDGYSRLGIQVGFDKLDDISLSDGFFMRFNPYGQYIFPNRQAGIYGQLPLSHAFIFQDSGEDFTGWGNLELGGFYMPWSNNELIIRAGLIAATASEDLNEVITNAATAYERFTDFLLIAPNYTSARLSASTIQQFDQFFFRADGGFDLVMDRPNAATGPTVFFRANVAAGYRVPDTIDLTAELVNFVFVNGDVDGGITNRLWHTLAFSARTPGVNQLHVGTVFPLDGGDGGPRGNIWILSFGYQRAWN